MAKADLVDIIVAESDVARADASVAVDIVVDAITAAISKCDVGDRLRVPKLGTFQVRQRPARTGRNPQTGEPLRIESGRVLGFKASTVLRSAAR